MECEYQIKGTTLRIFLPQELDHHVSARLREEADLMVETHFIRTIIFDFSGTDWMDSSGMGFSFMEAFMDAVEVESSPGKGTRVVMKKEIR